MSVGGMKEMFGLRSELEPGINSVHLSTLNERDGPRILRSLQPPENVRGKVGLLKCHFFPCLGH